MKFKKARKPRGIKKSGLRSYDLCSGCYHPHCDPMFHRPGHIDERLAKGLCPACGKDPCACKSSLGLSYNFDMNKQVDYERFKAWRKSRRLKAEELKELKRKIEIK